MKKMKFIIIGAALMALAIPSVASADVVRHQAQSSTLTMYLPTLAGGNGLLHTYQITQNPCDNTFVGTGGSEQGLPWKINETISGSITDGKLSFVADYHHSAAGFPGFEQYDNYKWYSTAPGASGTLTATDTTDYPAFPVEWSLSNTTSTSNYRNHGEYVKAMGGGDDAAHSCIGMPVNSSK
jgi:opacity protein-like surface antigen